MNRISNRRTGHRPLTKNLLLPLPLSQTRALSLEHHLALATIGRGYGNVDLLLCLLKAVYVAFYLRDETPEGESDRPFQLAEAALERCIARAEQGEKWIMLDKDKVVIERVLLLHDEQLAATPAHRYIDALNKLHRFAIEGLTSPIPALFDME
ncbi:hypothetical protein [Burkholderia cepacia]|uniref:hypothetical protein n=1 Tax=Burkholderia cepacia TaxID=292 RepID=UPI0009B96D2C|nr:hypothetical protein [Burkholderia cepacia]